MYLWVLYLISFIAAYALLAYRITIVEGTMRYIYLGVHLYELCGAFACLVMTSINVKDLPALCKCFFCLLHVIFIGTPLILNPFCKAWAQAEEEAEEAQESNLCVEIATFPVLGSLVVLPILLDKDEGQDQAFWIWYGAAIWMITFCFRLYPLKERQGKDMEEKGAYFLYDNNFEPEECDRDKLMSFLHPITLMVIAIFLVATPFILFILFIIFCISQLHKCCKDCRQNVQERREMKANQNPGPTIKANNYPGSSYKAQDDQVLTELGQQPQNSNLPPIRRDVDQTKNNMMEFSNCDGEEGKENGIYRRPDELERERDLEKANVVGGQKVEEIAGGVNDGEKRSEED
ncbi:unnamed protein product [Moneuplotes crassus]|uniref:Uncharacterized protein n=1 Tax=Euplotes crassus TaxID=5936 RepID=A0AAD1UF44_EUPCR|nr:unnamed protein product [Moneuplotes crassus]